MKVVIYSLVFNIFMMLNGIPVKSFKYWIFYTACYAVGILIDSKDGNKS